MSLSDSHQRQYDRRQGFVFLNLPVEIENEQDDQIREASHE